MKKAFDQTVRELKREVNKKVLKVPGIEQKVLDATSNEPWGPHGSLLADIAQATKTYHEYQMIMTVIWKRINDTGKNWRHVYKALIILEYLVAHGSERVIDEIREHAYQISTLSDFQYIDSSGRDQGSNVRKKSQSLVVLVNDKERIQEVRQKVAANRDKFRNTSMGGMYRPSSYSGIGGNIDRYDDDRYEGRYGSRDDDHNGYGRDRDWGSRDDDRYGKYGGDGDRYCRDLDERYGRDGYRYDDYRGRSRSVDDYEYGTRSRSSDRERERAYEDDGQYSSRGSGARADDHSQNGSTSAKQHDRKFSEQNLGGPPSYEDAVGEARSPGHSERDGETSASAPTMSASLSTSPGQAIPAPGTVEALVLAPASAPPAAANKEVGGFDEFDPRGPFSAVVPVTSNCAEMDLIGSLSDSFSNPLAIIPVSSGTTTIDGNASANFSSGLTFGATPSASSVTNQPFEDPFGDGPFKAVPTTNGVPFEPRNIAPTFFHPMTTQRSEPTQPIPELVDKTVNYEDAFPGLTNTTPISSNAQLSSTNTQFLPHEFPTSNQDNDILADILPVSEPPPPVALHTVFPAQGSQAPSYAAQTSYPSPLADFPAQTGQPGQVGGYPGPISFASQKGFPAPSTHTVQPSAYFYSNFLQQEPATPHMASQISAGPATQYNTANLFSQAQPAPTKTSQPHISSSTGPLAMVPQPSKDKFDPKSGVWADTLSRGLVNLNISGPKINPLADIGVDFDAINRKEKRMGKPTITPVTSTINMGKAMGSGSGMGRAAASSLRPPPNPMVGSGMGMGGPGAGMGMGGYGGMNQPMGRGAAYRGDGINQAMSMGMGMNMGMAQGSHMQPTGFPPESSMAGGYNPTMEKGGGYAPQQPYSGGY